VGDPATAEWVAVIDGLRGAGRADLKRLQRVIARAVGRYATADEIRADLVQEVMLKMCSAARRDLIREPHALPQFARTVARNGAANWLAGAAARRRRELEAGLAALMASATATGEPELDLKRALDALPEQVRCVIAGIYFQGATYEELAAHLGVSVVTIKRRRASALSALRRSLLG
jgi:RNA polymerase sigma factor (sigma-70 family)